MIQIYLDNYDNACFPGQTISGRVEIVFSEPKNIRAIRLKLKGEANTDWTESERYYDDFFKEERTRDVRYTAEEVYFNAEYNLVGGGGSEMTLPVGRQAYPFSYILPQQLPSSFEDMYGSIHYTVKATVDCPWQFDLEAKIVLNVLSPLDLNFLPGVREPVHISIDKTMCSCWCNDAGALTFDISLPVTGYTPGQNVQIGAHIENLTNVSAESVKFKITKTLEFVAHFPSTSTRYIPYVIESCYERGVGAHGDKSWTIILTIPNEQSFPNLVPCNIINVRYNLEAEVVVPCPHTNLSADIPLMIGHVPLSQVATNVELGPPAEYSNATAPPESSPMAGSAPYPPAGGGDVPYQPSVGWTIPAGAEIRGLAAAPPSYEEAQGFGNKGA